MEPRNGSMREALSVRPLRAAVVGVTVAQLSMVALMTMGPMLVHSHHGASAFATSVVVSVHLAGMFGFALATGTMIDRLGWRRRPWTSGEPPSSGSA